MKGSLQVLSVRATLYPSKTAHERTWKSFLTHGTSHSNAANMLPEIINRCEREGIAYELKAMPGSGYFIKPLV